MKISRFVRRARIASPSLGSAVPCALGARPGAASLVGKNRRPGVIRTGGVCPHASPPSEAPHSIAAAIIVATAFVRAGSAHLRSMGSHAAASQADPAERLTEGIRTAAPAN
jgi:hypothetical protein